MRPSIDTVQLGVAASPGSVGRMAFPWGWLPEQQHREPTFFRSQRKRKPSKTTPTRGCVHTCFITRAGGRIESNQTIEYHPTNKQLVVSTL